MKSYLLPLLVLVSFQWVIAQENYTLKSSKFTIAGSSNVHDWESDVTKVKATGTFTVDAGQIKAISGVKVEIPVTGIKSAKGSIMDKKTYEALKSDQNPSITFTLTKINSISPQGLVKASGNLKLAGTSKPIDLEVTVQTSGNGELTISGSKPLKMTTFGIEPPTAMFGAMKTADDITIKFNVTMAKAGL